MKFSREWAMPSPDTFAIPPINQFVRRYLTESKRSIDPFARNSNLATVTNDINPDTSAQHHKDAVTFLSELNESKSFDLAIVDPPYSPRQISECYQQVGIPCGAKDTQNSSLYAKVRSSLLPLLTDDAIVLSFGWNSVGMGQKHGFQIIEILLVCHGGAHNDTICVAERRVQSTLL